MLDLLIRWTVLDMPENDLEELAENFFCHMHEHSDGHKEDQVDLTNELNPLRDANKQRKSILSSKTAYVLNRNHIKPESIRNDDRSNLLCSNCSHIIGYKSNLIPLLLKILFRWTLILLKDFKRSNDYFIWKSEVLVDGASFNVLNELKQGRYLIETNEPNIGLLFIWVIADSLSFNHVKVDELATDITLNSSSQHNRNKKAMYKFYDSTSSSALTSLRNDVNIIDIKVSAINFNSIRNTLDKSRDELCESFKTSKEYDVSIF